MHNFNLLLLLLLLGFLISSTQSSTIRTYSHMRSFYSLAVANSFQCVFYVIILLMFCYLNCRWLLSRHVYSNCVMQLFGMLRACCRYPRPILILCGLFIVLSVICFVCLPAVIVCLLCHYNWPLCC